VSEILSRFGHGGRVAVEEPLEASSTAAHVVKAYLPYDRAAAAQVRRARTALGRLRAFDLAPLGPLETRVLDAEDWLTAWRAHYRPLVVGNFLVKPSWVDAAPGGRLVVELDPGMAFGTGLHPTTRQVLEALSTIRLAGRSVLDVGTGSGILAMAARAAGARPVVAVDTDRIAVETARANVARAFPDIEVGHGSARDVAGTFDVVLANITAGVLCQIAPDLRARTRRDGTCLLAGIIADGEPDVLRAIDAAGFAVRSREVREDWIALILRVD
jgi:ribosomal protein L11 methyltransferase